MRITRIVSVWVILTICIAGMLIGKTPAEIDVACPQPQGCFMAIGEAIEAAPEGATIQIQPGLYYERPLIIEKSLTLKGVGIAFETVIRGIEPEPLLTIRHPEGGRPVAVIIQYLSVQAPILPFRPKRPSDSPAGVVIKNEEGEGSPEDLQVSIQESTIFGLTGIRIRGPAKVTINKGRIYSWGTSPDVAHSGIGVDAFSCELVISDSKIESLRQGIYLEKVRALIQRNEIRDATSEMINTGIMIRGETEATISENVIENNESGIILGFYLVGTNIKLYLKRNKISNNGVGISFEGRDIVAILDENEIVRNGMGVRLGLPPCTGFEQELFSGQVLGKDNEIHDNGQDLCPEDYPWPPGFVREGG
jgi:nitrous oxidase accessory protein NosD